MALEQGDTIAKLSHESEWMTRPAPVRIAP
jgi:hypothetical protein